MGRRLSLLIVCTLTITACGDSTTGDAARDLEPGPAVCSEGPARPAAEVAPDYATIGPTGNAIRRGGDHLWIVESGSNTVSRLAAETGDFERAFIDVGNGHNPYDIAVAPDDGRAYVTNYMANSVTVADTETGEVVAEIEDERFDNPSGIAVADGRLYVTNIAHSGDGFGEGAVTIIDREDREVIGHHATAWKNPVFARRVESPDGPRVAVTAAGALERGKNWGPTSAAGLELWRPEAPPSDVARETFELGLEESSRIGTPGRPLPTPDGRALYFTSATAPVLFEFDLAAGEWVRGVDDPIALYEAEGDTLHHGAMGPDGLLYVTSFNQDALYLYDTTCDAKLAGPVDLGSSPDLLEGPHGIALDTAGEGTAAYYIFSRANALGRIRLRR